MYKLSIIIPIFNASTNLDSLFSQLNTSFTEKTQIIFVDDGSTDNTLSILTEYANIKKNTSVITQCNQGPGIARNNGFSVATGEWIWFIDSDDIIAKNSFNIIEKITTEAPNTDFFYIGFELNKHSKKQFSTNELFSYTECTNKEAILFFQVAPWTRIYNAQFLKNNKLSFPPFYKREDLVEHLRLSSLAKSIKKIDAVLYEYKINNTSLSKKIKNTDLQEIETILSIVGDFKQTDFLDEINYALFCHMREFQNIDSSSSQKIFSFFNEELKINPYFILENKTKATYENSKYYKLIKPIKKIFKK